jgi:hypothetical protein
VSGQFHAPAVLCPGERASGTNWIGGWVAPRAGLDVEKRNIFTLSGLKLRTLGRPARSQSLYRLYVFRMVLTINSDCFPEEYRKNSLCNGDVGWIGGSQAGGLAECHVLGCDAM